MPSERDLIKKIMADVEAKVNVDQEKEVTPEPSKKSKEVLSFDIDAFKKALENNNAEEVKRLLSFNYYSNQFLRDDCLDNSFRKVKSEEMFQVFLEAGAIIEGADLACAIVNGNEKGVELFLKHGVDIEEAKKVAIGNMGRGAESKDWKSVLDKLKKIEVSQQLKEQDKTKPEPEDEQKEEVDKKIIESKKAIFENAGDQPVEVFQQKMSDLENLLLEKQTKGKDKLKDTIEDIKQGPDGNEHFVDGKVAYLPAKGEAIFVGDIHGDAEAVRSIVDQAEFIEKMEKGEKDLKLVFLGDYADRGEKDVAAIMEVMNLQMKYPENVVLLRGNHEESSSGERYGLLLSFIEKYGKEKGEELFEQYNETVAKMPGVVITGNGIVGVHGGIPSQDVNSLKDLNNEKILSQMRWNDPWSDPFGGTEEWSPNSRGGDTKFFSQKPFERFLKNVGGKAMVRSHDYPDKGYAEVFDGKLVTIFSNGSEKSVSSGYKKSVEDAIFLKTRLDQEEFKPEFSKVSYKEEQKEQETTPELSEEEQKEKTWQEVAGELAKKFKEKEKEKENGKKELGPDKIEEIDEKIAELSKNKDQNFLQIKGLKKEKKSIEREGRLARNYSELSKDDKKERKRDFLEAGMEKNRKEISLLSCDDEGKFSAEKRTQNINEISQLLQEKAEYEKELGIFQGKKYGKEEIAKEIGKTALFATAGAVGRVFGLKFFTDLGFWINERTKVRGKKGVGANIEALLENTAITQEKIKQRKQDIFLPKSSSLRETADNSGNRMLEMKLPGEKESAYFSINEGESLEDASHRVFNEIYDDDRYKDLREKINQIKFDESGENTAIQLSKELESKLKLTKDGAKKNSASRKKIAQLIKETRAFQREAGDKTQESKEENQKKSEAEIKNLLKNYIQTKHTGMDVAKEGLNSALVFSGVFTAVQGAYLARGLAYAGMDVAKLIGEVKRNKTIAKEKGEKSSYFADKVKDNWKMMTGRETPAWRKGIVAYRGLAKIASYAGIAYGAIENQGDVQKSFETILEKISDKPDLLNNFQENAQRIISNYGHIPERFFEQHGKQETPELPTRGPEQKPEIIKQGTGVEIKPKTSFVEVEKIKPTGIQTPKIEVPKATGHSIAGTETDTANFVKAIDENPENLGYIEKHDKIFPGNEVEVSYTDGSTKTIIVEKGDNLWEIIKKNDPKEIESINVSEGSAGLEPSDLQESPLPMKHAGESIPSEKGLSEEIPQSKGQVSEEIKAGNTVEYAGKQMEISKTAPEGIKEFFGDKDKQIELEKTEIGKIVDFQHEGKDLKIYKRGGDKIFYQEKTEGNIWKPLDDDSKIFIISEETQNEPAEVKSINGLFNESIQVIEQKERGFFVNEKDGRIFDDKGKEYITGEFEKTREENGVMYTKIKSGDSVYYFEENEAENLRRVIHFDKKNNRIELDIEKK